MKIHKAIQILAILSLFIYTSFFSACQSSDKSQNKTSNFGLNFTKVNSFEVKMDTNIKKQHIGPARYKKLKSGTEYWIVEDFFNNRIFFYSYPQGKYQFHIDIPVKRYYNGKLYKNRYNGFKFLSDSSIIVVLSSTLPRSYENYLDSTILELDFQGNILQDYSLKKTRLLPHSANKDAKEPSFALSFNVFGAQVLNQKLFLNLRAWYDRQKYGELVSHNQDSIIGYIDLNNKKPNYTALPIHLAEHTYGKYWQLMATFAFAIPSHHGTLLVSYPNSSEIIDYNVESGKSKSYNIPSCILGTVQGSNHPLEMKKFISLDGLYHSITYDPYRKLYYRLIRIPKSFAKTIEEKNKIKNAIVIFDTNFVKIGEEYLPDDVFIYSNIIPTKDAVYFRNLEKTYASNNTKICYEGYKIEVNQKPSTACNDKAENLSNAEMDNNGYLKYFKKYHKIPKKNSTAVVIYVPVEESCPYCVQQMYKAFDKLIQEFPDHELYLLATTESQNALDETKKSKNFPQKHPHLKTDASGQHLNYILRAINPRVFLLDEKKVVKAFDVMPADAPLVEGYIRTFFSGQTPIIK